VNILIEYLYRDAGNNKIWGDVVFSNRMNLDISVLECELRNALIDGEFFITENVGLPSLRFDRYDEELDHGWHEFFSIKKTENHPNDDLGRDIYDFIGILKLSVLHKGTLKNRYFRRSLVL
jgi:hypothetical protein